MEGLFIREAVSGGLFVNPVFFLPGELIGFYAHTWDLKVVFVLLMAQLAHIWPNWTSQGLFLRNL